MFGPAHRILVRIANASKKGHVLSEPMLLSYRKYVYLTPVKMQLLQYNPTLD